MCKRLLGRVLEVHRAAGHAQPVVGVVDGLTRLKDAGLLHRAVQARVQRPRGDAGNLGGQLALQRVDRAGVAGALDVERAGKLALALEALNQVQHLLARTAHSGHARRGVDGRLDIAVECFHLGRGEFDDGHRALLLLGQHGLALAHEAGAVRGNDQRILSADTTSSVGGGDFTHGHALNRGRPHAEVGE